MAGVRVMDPGVMGRMMAVARFGRGGASGADQGQNQRRQGHIDHFTIWDRFAISNFTHGHVHSPK